MTTMMRWDPFQDLRSAQDEMAQMNPTLAHALGLHTNRAMLGPRPGRRPRHLRAQGRLPGQRRAARPQG